MRRSFRTLVVCFRRVRSEADGVLKRLAILVLACLTLGGCAGTSDEPSPAQTPSETDPQTATDRDVKPPSDAVDDAADDAEAAP